MFESNIREIYDNLFAAEIRKFIENNKLLVKTTKIQHNIVNKQINNPMQAVIFNILNDFGIIDGDSIIWIQYNKFYKISLNSLYSILFLEQAYLCYSALNKYITKKDFSDLLKNVNHNCVNKYLGSDSFSIPDNKRGEISVKILNSIIDGTNMDTYTNIRKFFEEVYRCLEISKYINKDKELENKQRFIIKMLFISLTMLNICINRLFTYVNQINLIDTNKYRYDEIYNKLIQNISISSPFMCNMWVFEDNNTITINSNDDFICSCCREDNDCIHIIKLVSAIELPEKLKFNKYKIYEISRSSDKIDCDNEIILNGAIVNKTKGTCNCNSTSERFICPHITKCIELSDFIDISETKLADYYIPPNHLIERAKIEKSKQLCDIESCKCICGYSPDGGLCSHLLNSVKNCNKSDLDNKVLFLLLDKLIKQYKRQNTHK